MSLYVCMKPLGAWQSPSVWGLSEVSPLSVEKRLTCVYICLYEVPLYRGFAKPPLFVGFVKQPLYL